MKPKDLLEKQMTRQEFLKVTGMALLTIFGVNNLITLLMRSSQSQNTAQVSKVPASHGFGSRTFGN